MRILHIISSLGLGGAETLLYRLIARDQVNEHVVVSLGPSEWYSSRLSNIPLYHLDMDSPASIPSGIWRLNKIIRQSDADLVQCWMYRSNLVGGFLAQLAGKPVVWGIHNSSVRSLRLASRVLAYVSSAAARWNPDFIINCSVRSAELHAKLRFPAARTAVVHNGFDPAMFFPDERSRQVARAALGIQSEIFLVGSLTRWIGYKDVPTLLRALRIAANRGVPLRCILLGQKLGGDNEELMDVVRQFGCADIVRPLGMRSDVQDLARAMDLHVLSSLTEAFPNVVAETMLSGAPNVVTDVGDTALMVGSTGWVVPVREPERLADAIVQAHEERNEHPEKWNARREASREQIVDNFSLDRMAIGYETVWRDVVTRRQSH